MSPKWHQQSLMILFAVWLLLSLAPKTSAQEVGQSSRSSCYGGVFMENVSNATPETRDLSPTDYHCPCSKLDAKYRSECYVMQTSRMTEMGLSTERIFQECEKAGEIPRPVHGLGGP